MGCLLAIAGMMFPRAAIFFIWLLTGWFREAYNTAVWPLLGFIFMPFTTLAYMGAMLHGGQVSGWWLVLVIIAIVCDVSSWGESSQHSKQHV